MTTQRDHREPVWTPGEKEEPGWEQLVCGLDLPLNWRDADISDNSRKSDRFLPFRVVGDGSSPCEEGDLCLFLVEGEWVELEWLGEEWYKCTTTAGRFHQARCGRRSAQAGDGIVRWRTRADAERLEERDARHRRTLERKLADGEKWGWLLPENKNSAEGGRVSGPKTATERNQELRKMKKVLTRDGVEVVCEPGEIATRIVEKLLAVAPECAPMSPKDVHRVWDGKMSKGWTLLSIG